MVYNLKCWWRENSGEFKFYLIVMGLIIFGIIPWLIGIFMYLIWLF